MLDDRVVYADSQGFIGFDFFDIFNPKAAVQVAVRAATGNPNIVVTDIGHIPVISEAVSIVGGAAAQPFRLAQSIASGERIDKAFVDNFKRDLALIKEAAPLAQAVVSFVPGVGTGVAAAIGAGVAIAEGRDIDEIAKAAIRGAVPGGPAAVAAFDAALKIGAGENVGKAVLESAREAVPAQYRQAFDIGLAVVTGENLQNALAKGIMDLAPAQLQSLAAAGQKAIASVPALSTALRTIKAGTETEGFNLAVGLLGQKGINEKAISAIRAKLDTVKRQGFDAALRAQSPKIVWLRNVTEGPPVVFNAPLAPREPTPQEIESKLLAALMLWGAKPTDTALQQQLLGTSWQWAAVMKNAMQPEDTRLASAITAWSKKPNDATAKQAVIDAGQAWGRKKGVVPTKTRVQLKPAAPAPAPRKPPVLKQTPAPARPTQPAQPAQQGFAYWPYP